MFWDNYVSLCSKNGVSPNAVAAELGKSSGSVTAWKNGATPRETTIKQIADYFGVSVDVLLYGELPWEIAATKSALYDNFVQKEKSPVPEGTELIPGYEDLSEENKAKARDFIAFLLSQQ